MFKKSLLLTLLLAMFLPWAANAQTTITLTGNLTQTIAAETSYGFYDSGGPDANYDTSENYTATFTCVGNITINFSQFVTESSSNCSSWDYMLIYDGTAATGTLICRGQTGCSSATLTTGTDYVATSGTMTVEWHSDGSTTAAGWVATITGGVAPSCLAPTLGEAQYITEEGASFQWTENGSATDWVLQYSTNVNFTNPTSLNRSGIPALAITGLNSGTTYYVRVKSDCGGGDQSAWSNVVTFTTECAVYNIPYTYGFEEASPFECWTPITGVTRASSTSYANNGTYYLRFAGTTSNLVALPQFNAPTNTLRVEFYTRPEGYTYSSCGTFSVGYMTDITDATTFVAVETYAYNDWTSNTHVKKTVDFTDAPATANIAFRHNSGSSSYYWFADDVTVKEIPSCLAPTGLAANASTTSAELSWTANSGETAWTLYWKKTTDENYTEVANATNPYTLNGLTAATNYEFYVVANCSADDVSEPSEVFTFTTDCDVIAALGYTENFDSYTAGNNVLPTCWNYINTTTNSTYAVYPRVYADGSYSTYANSAPNCLYFYSYGSSDPQPQYAILPEMTGLAGAQVTLNAKGYNATSTFKIGTMSDPTDASTFTMIEEQTLTTSYPEEPFEYIIPATCTDNYLAIMIDAAPSGYNTRGVYVDDIVISEAPTCIKPTGLAANASTISAELSWTANSGETAWTVYYKKTTDENYTEIPNVDENPFTLEGLTAATNYEYYVVANCSADDSSEPSDVFTFATECDAITITEDNTYSEGFEDYTGVAYNAAGVVPACWDNYSTGSVAPHIIGSGTGNYVYLHEGSNALTFYGNGYNYAAMPEFTNALSELEIKFWMQTESASNGSLVLGYITANDEEYNTFTAIETYANNTGSMVQRTTDLNEVPATATRLVFRWYYENQWSCCIDDVEVTLLPTCMAPTALEVTATTANTSTLSWTAGGSETAWQICLNGNMDNLIMANSNPFTIDEEGVLSPATTYTVKVRAYCGADDQSDWSNEVSFTTACEVIVVDAAHPFTEGFESTTFAPTCWESIPYVSGTTTRRWTRSTTSSNIHTGSGSAYSGYYGPIYLVMPDLQLGTDGDGAQLSFWSNNTYVNDYDKNSVVLIDGDNEIELWSPESVVGGWEEIIIDLTNYMGQTISLAFKYEGNNSHGWYVDDVQVAMIKSFTKSILGYGTNNGGYFLIASPLADPIDPATIDGMIAETADDYDLYAFSPEGDGQGNEWLNYKQDMENFKLVAGQGYLYAKKTNVDLVFTGVPYSGDGVIQLMYNEAAGEFAGWNLVGNPFGVTATVNRDFYTMNEDGSEIIAATNSSIEYMEGVFVIAEGEGETVTFSIENTGDKSAKLALNLSQGQGVIDRAIVRFGENRHMPKIQINPNHTKVYIPMDNVDYAVVSSEGMGELPVSFKAASNGTYTLSLNAEEVSFAYLHLIDNMTGNEVDLLQTPSYSFEARTTDYANRFKLVFATGNADDTFAFFSNGNFVINNEGDATLQVIDVTGRIVKSESINGCANVNVNAAPGVYTLRLVNGDNVKVQKVVVR